MELKAMGISVDIDQNVFSRDIRDSAKAAGLAEGRAEGKMEGMVTIVRDLLETRFGPLPRWAQEKLVLTAATLEGVLGKKHSSG
jgi:hypothetical protein